MPSESKALSAAEERDVRSRDSFLQWTERNGHLMVKRMTDDWEMPWPEEVDRHRLLATLDAARSQPSGDLAGALDAIEPYIEDTPDGDGWRAFFRLRAALRSVSSAPVSLDESGPDLVFSTSPAPEGIDTDCMFLASADRISVHISRRAINAQVARIKEQSHE